MYSYPCDGWGGIVNYIKCNAKEEGVSNQENDWGRDNIQVQKGNQLGIVYECVFSVSEIVLSNWDHLCI